MRTPNPKAIAYYVRSRRVPMFRRCGITFTSGGTRVAAASLTEAQRTFLLNSDDVLEVQEIVEGDGKAAGPSATPSEESMPGAEDLLTAPEEEQGEAPSERKAKRGRK